MASNERSPLELLLEVQDEDVAVDRLAYRSRALAERAEVTRAESRRAEARARATETGDQVDKLAVQQRQFEEHAATVRARIAEIDARLTSGRAGSYRDEQAMSEEVSSLARQLRAIEDQELEVMEALDPLEDELRDLQAELADATSEAERSHERLSSAVNLIEMESATVRSRRDELAADLPSALATTYERLRQKLGGVGAARLLHGACDGCHLQLPASELARLRRAGPDEVVYCDQCGRILVP